VETWVTCALALLALALATVPARVDASARKRSHRKHPFVRANLPVGWQWPPTPPMRQDGQRCLRDLTRLEVKWKPGTATRKIVTPVIVDDMMFGGVHLVPRWGKGPYVMDCLLARALARHVGPALRNMQVAELRFGQIYKYREVAGKKGVLSRHSLGLAMDVYAFVTRDGTAHVVQDEYLAGDEVLLEVERRVTDTGAFRTLLTPGNDPRHHYDHFHFEARAAGDKVVSKPTREPADSDEPVEPADPADDSNDSIVRGPASP
jgi:hypothetical protein